MKFIVILALASSSATGGAAAAASVPPGSWNTSAELGAIATSGNTVGASVTGKVDARQELADWSNQFTVAGFFQEDQTTLDDGETARSRSAERISVTAKAAYKLMGAGKKLFVLGSHVDDRFGAYTSYNSVAVGHSSQLLKAHGNSVDVEIGPGYFSGTRAGGDTESGFTVRGAAAVKLKLSPSATFSEVASVERGTANIRSSAETSLSTRINRTMQMKAAFVARNDTNVPEGKKNTDTQTSVTLVYSF